MSNIGDPDSLGKHVHIMENYNELYWLKTSRGLDEVLNNEKIFVYIIYKNGKYMLTCKNVFYSNHNRLYMVL